MSPLLTLMFWAYAGLVSSQVQNIIILAGQSNMSGRGGVVNLTWDGIIPLQSQSQTSIFRLDANSIWQQAIEPLHKDIDVRAICGIGPGMSFANRVLEMGSNIGTIGLVPCAIGGTKISEWRRGSELYDQMVKRAQAAVQGGGRIRVMLWYQGESDTVEREDARLYKMRLETLFEDVRADLLLPTLPIIQVALASGKGPHIEAIRKTQLELELDNLKCVDAKGLALEPDKLHITTLSQVQLGHMLAQTFLQSLHMVIQHGIVARRPEFDLVVNIVNPKIIAEFET